MFTELVAPVVMLQGFMVMAMFTRFVVVMLKRFMVGMMPTKFMMVMMLKGFMMVMALKGPLMVMVPVRKLALAARSMVVVLIVNHKAQRFLLADALTDDQDLINGGAFADSLATRGLPEHMRSVLGRQIALREHIVGNVRDLLEALLQAGKLDALSNNFGRRIVDVNITEPQARWRILDDKQQRVIGTFADTFIEKKRDSRASLDWNSIPLLPPDDGTVPSFNEALAEHMIEDVFQISELVIWVLELDELGSGRDVKLRSKAVRDPKLGGHDDRV